MFPSNDTFLYFITFSIHIKNVKPKYPLEGLQVGAVILIQIAYTIIAPLNAYNEATGIQSAPQLQDFIRLHGRNHTRVNIACMLLMYN